jgi:hypothetical protein
MEADIFGAKNAPAAAATTPPAPAPQAPAEAAPPPPPHPRPQEEQPPPAPVGASFVLELQTTGFASGPLGGGLAPAPSTLGGGLFAGARLAGDLSDLMLGATVNFVSWSNTTALLGVNGPVSTTMSGSLLAVGAGARYSLLRANDGRVDLYGAGDLGFVRTSGRSGSESGSSSGITAGAGPGLRLWIYDHLAIGYVARMRFMKQAGSTPPGDSTVTGLEGAFQVTGVF